MLPLDSATSKTYTGDQSCIFKGKGCSHGKFALFGLRNFQVGSFDQISKWEVLTNRNLAYTIVQTRVRQPNPHLTLTLTLTLPFPNHFLTLAIPYLNLTLP